MESISLDADASGVADALGVAIARLGPQRSRQTWYVTNSAVSGASASNPECRLYLGTPAPSNLLGATYTGNADSTELPRVRVGRGQVLTAVWTRCTPGARMTLSLYGTIQLGE